MTEREREPEQELAGRLEGLWAVETSPDEVSGARSAALAAFGAVRRRRRRRWALAAVSAAAVSLGAVSAAAAQDAMPGDATYGLKLGMERVEIGLARGDEAEAEAWLDIAETRIEEVERAGAEERFSLLPEILDGYSDAVAALRPRVDAVEATQPDAEVLARSARELRIHDGVLSALLEVVPPQARPGLERARDATRGPRGDVGVPPHVRLPEVPPDTGPPPTVPAPEGEGAPGRPPAPAPSRETAPPGPPEERPYP